MLINHLLFIGNVKLHERQGMTKRLFDSPGLTEQHFGLALSYHGLPDRQASIEHECGIVGCFFLMQTSDISALKKAKVWKWYGTVWAMSDP